MASKPETSFRLRIERALPRSIYREKMNNPFRGGTADCWYSGRSDDLWVEYKFLPQLPQRGIVDAKRIGLSMLQLQWLRGRYEEGRNVCVITGCPSGGVIMLDLEWEAGITAETFRERTVSVKELAAWIECKTSR